MILSCVILNYNDSQTTIQLINKIKDYSLIDFIVVIDNNSTDDSYEKLKKNSNNRIIVIKADKNGGYGYGNNLGINYSYDVLKSNYTLICNPDVEFEENILLPLIKILKRDNKNVISTCVPINNKKTLTPAWKETNGFEDVLSASLICNKILQSRYYDSSYYNKKEFVKVYQVPGSLLMVDTEAMVNYGMYDEDIFLYEEEKVLATKMKQHNLKTIVLLNLTYIHNHNVSISKTFKSHVKTKQLLLESKYKYIEKYRKFNKLQLFLSKFFFKVTLIEMFIYSHFFKNKRRTVL